MSASEHGRALAIVVPGSARFDVDGSYRITAGCRRVVREAERLAARRGSRLVVLSGWSPTPGPSEAEQMRDAWRGPDVELVLEQTATVTAQNASRTLPLLVERDVRRAIVVCAPVHLYRTRFFFRRLYAAHGIATEFHVAPVAPDLSALVWELSALTVRRAQLRAAQAELTPTAGER
jgi:uncharacterized SAM-binding protein YcdF (DUF218 family)